MKIYTDGGCHGNPGPGAWAFVLVESESIVFERSGFSLETTNNKMELKAVIEALRHLLESNKKTIEVYTDSNYVKLGITSWIQNWKKNGWKTANKKPVKNKELWQELDDLHDRLEPSWHWVKGHSGNIFNERCDTLVQESIFSNNTGT